MAAPLVAQSAGDAKLRTDREQLDRLRREREELQQQRAQLQSTVHDLSEEVSTLDREASMTSRLVKSLDEQLTSVTREVGTTSTDLARAEDELSVKRATMQRRQVDIYKRGPLYSVEALLSASTFGELVARYKYLHLVAQRDKELLRRVQELHDRITGQRASLVRFRQNIEQARTEKADEERRMRDLERERGHSLAQARRSAQATDARLKQLQRDEQRLGDAIASLDATRLRDIKGRPNAAAAAAPSTLHTSDYGQLNWPVEGRIIYSYGRVVKPNNTATRWNGIGIEAPEGTPVKSVAAGKVEVAAPFGTYGLTVIVHHGGGDYSVYGSLSRIATPVGTMIAKGQVIGYVGASDPELGPHLHFEMRPQGHKVDPLEWLRGSR